MEYLLSIFRPDSGLAFSGLMPPKQTFYDFPDRNELHLPIDLWLRLLANEVGAHAPFDMAHTIPMQAVFMATQRVRAQF